MPRVRPNRGKQGLRAVSQSHERFRLPAGNAQGIFFTRDYLAHLESIGTRVINGYKAFSFEISKAAQLALLHSLGLATPRSRIVNCAIEAISAAEEIGFPIIIKPNIGGRGAGIIRLDSAPELARAAAPAESVLGSMAPFWCRNFFQSGTGTLRASRPLAGNFYMPSKSTPRMRTLTSVRLRYAGPKTKLPARTGPASLIDQRLD